MMSNATGTNFSHNATDFQIEEAPISLTIVLLVTSLWIILINAVVFSCLITSRSAMKSYVNLQLLSLSVTDMFVGLFSVPVTLTYNITGSFPKYGVCASLFYFYISSQGATLYHALTICIHRLITVKRTTARHQSVFRSKYVSVFLQVLSVWMICFVLVSIPFLAFGRFGETLPSCSLNTLFKEDYTSAIGIFTSVLLIPHICLNIVYVYMFLYLKKKWKQIGMASTGATTNPAFYIEMSGATSGSQALPAVESTEITSVSSNRLCMKNEFDNMEMADTSTRGNWLVVKSPFKRQKRKRQKNSEQQNSPKSSSLSGYLNSNTRQKTAIERKTTVMGGRSKIEGQKRVLATLGILLIVLNVFMTPLDCLTLFEFLHKGYLSRKVKFIFLNMAILNSALNPIINVLRIKPFGEILKQRARRIICR